MFQLDGLRITIRRAFRVALATEERGRGLIVHEIRTHPSPPSADRDCRCHGAFRHSVDRSGLSAGASGRCPSAGRSRFDYADRGADDSGTHQPGYDAQRAKRCSCNPCCYSDYSVAEPAHVRGAERAFGRQRVAC